MTLHRFHAPDAARVGQRLRLPAEEARHLTRTLRLGPGAPVRVFDGRGHEFEAGVTTVDRGSAEVELRTPVTPAAESRTHVTLAVAALKGRALDTVVRDATMLGVRVIQPIVTRHTDRSAAAAAGRAAADRWPRIAVASAKQCGRAVVPDIAAVRGVAEARDAHADHAHIVLVEPRQLPSSPSDAPREAPGTDVMVWVGPEGGWSPEELDDARGRGARLVTLGGRTLRADAVPMVALSVLLFAWGDL